MKKLVFVLMILLAPFFIQAQHCDSINNHMVDGYSLFPNFALQLSDGNILVNVWQDTLTGVGTSPCFVKYYKISRQGAAFLDSVTYETQDWNEILMARLHDDGNPIYAQYRNVLAKYLLDQDNNKTDLNLTFFDDDVNFNESQEITIPLADTMVFPCSFLGAAVLDSYNDIILQYSIPTRGEVHFDRFGLDGSLKHKTIISSTVMPTYNTLTWEGTPVHGLKQCGKSPLRYHLYGTSTDKFLSSQKDFVSYELDSLFNIVNILTIPSVHPNSYPFIHNTYFHNGMVCLEDGSAFVVRDVRWTTELEATGIVKYDANGNMLKDVWFDSTKAPQTYGGKWDDYLGVDLQMDELGNLYFAFECVVDSVEKVVISKLDQDLNIIWERYGMDVKQPVEFHRYAECGLNILDEGGVAVFGRNSGFNGQAFPEGLFMMLVDDDGVGFPETANSLRPYYFYPNPVNDQLRMHYSPDVTPRYAEIYDLQGRLVSTQSNNLESIDMSDLPTGTYTLRIVMVDGTAYSNKVVKQ